MQVLHDVLPEGGKADAAVPAAALLYCERFVEFLVDLLSQALHVYRLCTCFPGSQTEPTHGAGAARHYA